MGPLVLVVEDDDDLRETLCEGLRLLGCEAACERSWDGALRRLYAGTARYHGPNACLLPDIVVLDYMMPGMDGLAILRFMRSRSEYRQIPVLVVSGTVTANQGTAGAAAWKVDGSAVTQPVSVAGTVLVDASGHTVPVSLSALPALAAGSAKVGQVAIDQTTPGTSNLVQVSSVGGTVAVSAASLPLPALAATSTIQVTQQASLTSIDGKTPALSGGSVPVVLTAGVASVGTVGLNAGAASIGTVGLNAGSASIGTVGLNAGTASIGHVDGQGTAGTPAGGVVTVQGVAGGTAQPVSGTFWQATQPVSLASAPLPWGSSYKHLAAAGTTVVKSGSGVLRRVVVGGVGITSSVTLYDNTAGSGTVISAIASLLAGGHYEYNAAFATGLTVVVAAATPPDVTVIWD